MKSYKFAKPMQSFFEGMACVFNAFGTMLGVENMRINSKTGKDAWHSDGEALRGDWMRVGNDLRTAYERYWHESRKK